MAFMALAHSGHALGSLDWTDFNAHHPIKAEAVLVRLIGDMVAGRINDPDQRVAYLQIVDKMVVIVETELWKKKHSRATEY